MTIEVALPLLLGGLVDGRCYPDVTPDNAIFPLLVYQGAGGEAHDYLERKLPGSEHYRIQVVSWAKTRLAANGLALQVRQRIIEQGTAFESAKTLGQAVGLYEDALKLYGSRQDFGIWIKVR